MKVSNKTSGTFATTVTKKDFRRKVNEVMKDIELNAFQDSGRIWLRSIEIIVEVDNYVN